MTQQIITIKKDENNDKKKKTKTTKKLKWSCKDFIWSFIKFTFRMGLLITLMIFSYKINLIFTLPIYMYLSNIYPRRLGEFAYRIIGRHIHSLLSKLYQKCTCKRLCLCVCLSNLCWIFFTITAILIYKGYLLVKEKYPELV